MDRNGYPEANEIKLIEEWDFKEGFLPLMEYVKSLWTYDDYFEQVNEEDYNFALHTGGWSGNEELIGALKDNLIFWMTCWIESRVGGHYKFMVKK